MIIGRVGFRFLRDKLHAVFYLIRFTLLKFIQYFFRPKHGYAVMQFIEDNTKGRLALGAGTLYGALNSLHDSISMFRGIKGEQNKECHLCERTAFRIVSHNTKTAM